MQYEQDTLGMSSFLASMADVTNTVGGMYMYLYSLP